MPILTFPYKRPFYNLTLTPQEISVRVYIHGGVCECQSIVGRVERRGGEEGRGCCCEGRCCKEEPWGAASETRQFVA